MYEEPDESEQPKPELASDPKRRAQEKVEEFRTHAQLAAVFEGPRKFDAELRPFGDAAREVQMAVGKLEKSKMEAVPVLPPGQWKPAAAVLAMADGDAIVTNDYHVSARPGETTIGRWLAGEQVDSFYGRMQAHLDAALTAHREEEQANLGWRGDPNAQAYLDALENLDNAHAKVEPWYLRSAIRDHGLFVLSTLAVDEMDVLFLCETLMGISPAELVGAASAPPDEEPSEAERAWYFKLFALRGKVEGEERMCFFTYMQKTDDSFDF